jgi:transketolase
MRNAFASEITALGLDDPRVVLLSGDIGNRLFDDFRAKAPSRFFNCGVAEANMIGVASGLAMCGLRPVTYTITPFTTTRCLEQIRVDVCYHDVPVIIVGTGSGLSYASLGPTHHSCEDIAMLRSLPGMTVLCPADAWEVRSLLRAALKHNGPVYMRIGKKGEACVHREAPPLEIGKGYVLESGSDVCLLSTGNMLPVVVEAANQLKKRGHSVQVVSFHTVKPLDVEMLGRVFASFPVVATIEEHSMIGGLGGAVAEWVVDQPDVRAKLLRFGAHDTFLHESTEQDHAREHFGLTAENIVRQCHDWVRMRARRLRVPAA